MAKKETINPITAFRKANEARKAVVMKSLKKAQKGIAQDTTSNVDSLNYNNASKYLSEKIKESQNIERSRQNIDEAQANKNTLDTLNQIYPGYQIPYQKKTGGISKSKKR
jgi:hypothetical protein